MTWVLPAVQTLVIMIVLGNLPIGLIWLERRLLGGFQDRYGPNRVGPQGLLQPLADAIKLIAKEDWVPPFADRYVFVAAPAIIVVTVMLVFATMPFTAHIHVTDLNVGLLFFLAMASLGVYSIVLAGWASNSKYSLVGGLRAAAQMISYELPMGISLLGVVMLAGSFRLGAIVDAQRSLWFCLTQPVGLIIFLIATLAEAKRIPFDLPEAESELVVGYHTEYSSLKFGFFFVGEYLDIVLVGALTTVLFLGGWHGPFLPGVIWFLLKVYAIIFVLMWFRWTFPRVRFDQLVTFAWKILIPLAFVNLLITALVLKLR